MKKTIQCRSTGCKFNEKRLCMYVGDMIYVDHKQRCSTYIFIDKKKKRKLRHEQKKDTDLQLAVRKMEDGPDSTVTVENKPRTYKPLDKALESLLEDTEATEE